MEENKPKRGGRTKINIEEYGITKEQLAADIEYYSGASDMDNSRDDDEEDLQIISINPEELARLADKYRNVKQKIHLRIKEGKVIKDSLDKDIV